MYICLREREAISLLNCTWIAFNSFSYCEEGKTKETATYEKADWKKCSGIGFSVRRRRSGLKNRMYSTINRQRRSRANWEHYIPNGLPFVTLFFLWADMPFMPPYSRVCPKYTNGAPFGLPICWVKAGKLNETRNAKEMAGTPYLSLMQSICSIS